MKFILSILTVVFTLGFAGSALAGPCDAAKREMTYGRVALQDASDKQGYLESAKQFEAAVGKAPTCAAAHFNLGIVYEKAGDFEKSFNSLKQYLTLAPKASDAEQVQEKIYELEYKILKAVEVEIITKAKKRNG